MFVFGLTAAICYVPGLTGASIPTQWALFSCVLPWFLLRPSQWTSAHWLGLGAFAVAASSLAWAPSTYDAVYGLWLFSLWALAFHLGTTSVSLAGLFRGLAAGLGVSSVIAIAQALGYSPVASAPGFPSGLFYNSTTLGLCAALVALALIELGEWGWLVAVAPALALSHSRGAWLVLAVGWVSTIIPLRWVGLGLTLGALAILNSPGPSDADRLTIWGQALTHLSLRGNGIGSFITLYFTNPHDPKLVVYLAHPTFTHNDYLQLWFELGLGALFIYAILVLALTQTYHTFHPVLVGFALAGIFYFPLWSPLPALIGCVVAGRLLADRAAIRDLGYSWRSDILLWFPTQRPWARPPRGAAIPVQPRT